MTPDRWSKVEALFHAALERSPHDRQAFLDAECGGDYGLRREVELLLAKGEQAGSFLEVSPLEVLTGRARRTASCSATCRRARRRECSPPRAGVRPRR